MKHIYWMSLMLLCISCEEVTIGLDKQEDEFVIEQGEHKSIYSLKKFQGNRLEFKATFDESAIYQTTDPDNQSDINKLIGFTECGTMQHQNSARFGWRWFNEELQIFAYIYSDGVRSYEYIATVPLNETRLYSIEKRNDGYKFKVQGGPDLWVKGNTGSCAGTENYFLWPYFGGDEPAPHDINIVIEQIETEPVEAD